MADGRSTSRSPESERCRSNDDCIKKGTAYCDTAFRDNGYEIIDRIFVTPRNGRRLFGLILDNKK